MLLVSNVPLAQRSSQERLRDLYAQIERERMQRVERLRMARAIKQLNYPKKVLDSFGG